MLSFCKSQFYTNSENPYFKGNERIIANVL